MVGMLQIITYMLAFYLVLKGFEILQIGLASNRVQRSGMIVFGGLVLCACVVAAIAFVGMQENMASSVSNGMHGLGG